MSDPTINTADDVRAYVAENIQPAIDALLRSLAHAIKAADVKTAQQQGDPAYAAALNGMANACVQFKNNVKVHLS